MMISQRDCCGLYTITDDPFHGRDAARTCALRPVPQAPSGSFLALSVTPEPDAACVGMRLVAHLELHACGGSVEGCCCVGRKDHRMMSGVSSAEASYRVA